MLNLSREEIATIRAALRLYQHQDQGDPDNRTDTIHSLATGKGSLVSLDADGITSLRILLKEHDPDHDPNDGASVCYACGWKLPGA